MLVMHQPGQDLLIQIVRKGVIYFSRRARGFNRLSDITADELQYDVINNLLLELQRSMDYFESQLKQPKQEQDLQDKMDVVTLYQQALQQRKPTASLVEQFDRAKTEFVQLQKLQTFINNRQQQLDQLYSPVLQHLDRIHDRGLWLTAFQLNQSNSSFQGVALEPVSVTRWLTKLRQFNYFQGQDFSHVSVSQIPEDTEVNFVLSADKGAK